MQKYHQKVRSYENKNISFSNLDVQIVQINTYICTPIHMYARIYVHICMFMFVLLT